MENERCAYGLGRITQSDWDRLEQEADRRQASSKLPRSVIMDWLLAGERLGLLGLHGMAAELLGESSISEDGYSHLWLIQKMLEAEFRQRAWADLRKMWPRDDFFEVAPTLTELESPWHAEGVSQAVSDLAGLEFVEARRNAAFVGGAGTMKTHFAVAIGLLAMTERDMRVKLFDTGRLVAALDAAAGAATFERLTNSLKRVDLVILDEFAETSFSTAGVALLARLLRQLAGKTSVLVTSRLDPLKWPAALYEFTQGDGVQRRFTDDCILVRTGERPRAEDFVQAARSRVLASEAGAFDSFEESDSIRTEAWERF